MPKRKHAFSSTKVSAPIVTESDQSITGNNCNLNASSSSNGSLDTWTFVAEDGKTPSTPPASPSSETNKITVTLSKDNIPMNVTNIENSNAVEGDSQKVEIIQSVKDKQKGEEESNISPPSPSQKKEITIDDISDGISIISDSESAGRQTPLYDLEEHPSICENICIKATKHQYSSREDYDESEADNEDEYEKDENEYDVTDNENNEMNCSNLQRTVGNVYSVHNRFIKCKSDLQVDHKQSHPLSVNTTDSFLSPQLQGQLIKYVKSSLKGVLYMTIITLVVAVFVGKFRQLISQIGNPDQGLTSVDGLQQRVDEMELKNNLMRAEIDLLNKQVKYLTSVNSLNSKHYHHNRHHDKQKEAFKAWSGLGDTIEQVYIKKDDLKKPFLCDDGRYVEVAAMCLDKQQLQEKAETFVDELSNTMDSILKEPRRSEPQDHAGTMPEMTSNKEFSRPIDEYLYSENISPDYWSTHASNKDARVDRGERGTKRFDKEYGEFSESKERIDKHREKKQEKRTKKMKKEKENRKRNEDKLSSREYREKEKYNSKEKIRDNFDWHQDYMQNRADARNSKHYDSKDNWYLERSKNREYQRYEAGGMNINGGDK